jgi:hypothetical protein
MTHLYGHGCTLEVPYISMESEKCGNSFKATIPVVHCSRATSLRSRRF